MIKQITNNIHISGDTEIIVKDPTSINLHAVAKKLRQYLSNNFFSFIDAIYVGEYQELERRDVTALFMDGAIFLSNAQPSESEAVRDIVHELGHALESHFPIDIYGDSELQDEFFEKRKLLYYLIKDKFECNMAQFKNLEFDEEFDEWLYKKLGYDNLSIFCNGIFLSPYAVTSIREYWAVGFEEFIFGKKFDNISPKLYSRIEDVMENLK